MTDTTAFENTKPWRVGRTVGRTIYVQLGPEPSDADVLIGVMDHPDLAAEACDAHNYTLTVDPSSESTRPVAVGNDYDTDSPWVQVHKDDDRSALEDDFEDQSGWFVRDVPAELVDRFQQANRDLEAAIAAIHDAVGFDSSVGRMKVVCGAYEGEESVINGHSFWDECSRCGWNRSDHAVWGI